LRQKQLVLSEYGYPVNSALFIKLTDVKWYTKEAGLKSKGALSGTQLNVRLTGNNNTPV
jgi:hypothetical protein